MSDPIVPVEENKKEESPKRDYEALYKATKKELDQVSNIMVQLGLQIQNIGVYGVDNYIKQQKLMAERKTEKMN